MKKWERNVIIGVSSGIVLNVAIVVAAWPFVKLHIMDAHHLREGIEKYHTAVSSMGLCKWLTLREEDGPKSTNFINKYNRLEAFFRWEETCFGGREHETVALILKYDDDSFLNAYADITSQPGFSNEIHFNYGDFEFFLNKSDTVYPGYSYTNFDLDEPSPYVKWINLVGFSSSRNEWASIGFYYSNTSIVGFYKFKTEYYPFNGWDNFFEEQFPFYNWKSSI